ncbi:MAG: hypothetical protein OYL97_20245 [Candidatus Poribacteria bacterium]|nr:hypothetical protein [Candidatus Poribacteria bacterium]
MNVNLHETLEEIRQWIGDRKATSPYTKEGCRVSMANIPTNRVVLDVDLAFPTDKAETHQCDFVLFYIDTTQSSLIGVPMELKRGDVDASEAVAQLQEGARIVDNCTLNDVDVNLVLILVHGGSIHRTQRNRLRTSRIRFRGTEFPINTARCGHQGNLAQAVAKSSKR